jgi:thiamine biosynthesis lipoprotein
VLPSARVSPLLATLVEVALKAAEESDGAVDPTVGSPLCALGYDRDMSTVDGDGVAMQVAISGWCSVTLAGNTLTLPQGAVLDLGATAKAFAADCCARLVADALDTGVLVSLGGDIATAGPAPDQGRAGRRLSRHLADVMLRHRRSGSRRGDCLACQQNWSGQGRGDRQLPDGAEPKAVRALPIRPAGAGRSPNG